MSDLDRSTPSPQSTRRTFLRGVGVTMALPWLESIPAWGASPISGGVPTPCPKRFAALFMGCGISPDHWWARGSGPDMELGRSLEPLRALRSKINVVDGLFNKQANGVGIHPGQTGNILSGAALQKGAELKGGISVDQLLARHLGEATPQPSLVLGCEQPITGYHETNFSMAYSSHISWSSATSPVPMEVYPSLAFDSLFDNKGTRRNKSILDRVRDEAEGLGRQVSSGDRARLDEYLTSVREVERRVEQTRLAKEAAEARLVDKNQPTLTMARPDNGLPEDIREHMRLMCDLVALGFQTDKTRLATLLLCRDISGLFYPLPRGPGRAPLRLARRPVRRLREGDELLRGPARLPGHPARRDAGRGRHRARQLLPAVHLEHVVGQPARLEQGPRGHGRRPGRDARDRPGPRLPGPRATTTASSARSTYR